MVNKSYRKGKTMEEIFGKKKAQEMKIKIKETLKRKYKDGKLIPWAKGLNKENSIKIKSIGKKSGESRKGKFYPNKNHFKKGCVPINKGTKRDSNFCNNCKERQTELWKNKDYKKMMKEKHSGKIQSEESKLKRSLKMKGRSNFWLKGKPLSKEHIKKISGRNSTSWKGGISRLPYSFDFDKKLKDEIREKFNYNCFECNYSEKQLGYKLSIHHINYDKQDTNIGNLIPLCKSCHSKTNWDREDWQGYFVNKINQ